MPGPRATPVPLIDWALLARSVPEFETLRSSLKAVPQAWLSAVEDRVRRREAGGTPIRDPISYRLSALQNGIINLQEGKYICDLVENALRDAFAAHLDVYSVPASSVPVDGWHTLKHRLSSSYSLDELLVGMDFSHLTGTMRLNWKRVSAAPGFRYLFWSAKRCRDQHAFGADMAAIRHVRNSVAHSKRLLTLNDLRWLYRKAECWLQPLGVDAATRVSAYRRRRPQFLAEIVLASGTTPEKSLR